MSKTRRAPRPRSMPFLIHLTIAESGEATEEKQKLAGKHEKHRLGDLLHQASQPPSGHRRLWLSSLALQRQLESQLAKVFESDESPKSLEGGLEGAVKGVKGKMGTRGDWPWD